MRRERERAIRSLAPRRAASRRIAPKESRGSRTALVPSVCVKKVCPNRIARSFRFQHEPAAPLYAAVVERLRPSPKSQPNARNARFRFSAIEYTKCVATSIPADGPGASVASPGVLSGARHDAPPASAPAAARSRSGIRT